MMKKVFFLLLCFSAILSAIAQPKKVLPDGRLLIPAQVVIDSVFVLTPSGDTVNLLRYLNSIVGSATFVNDVDYTVAAGVEIIVFTNLTANRTLSLPSAAAFPGRRLLIRHAGAGASFSINLSTPLRENATTTVSSVGNSAWVSVISDGTDWYIYAVK